MDPFVLLLSGPPGAGKTTVGRLVASRFPRSVCICSDWFWTTVVNGHVPPWEPASEGQNRAMIGAATATAVRMADAGYATVQEGVLGPWYFDVVRHELGASPVPVHYVVLRPDLASCLARATGRVLEWPEHRRALTAEGPIRQMWNAFADLAGDERFVLDTSALGPDETADVVCRELSGGRYRRSFAPSEGGGGGAPPRSGPDGEGR